MKKLMPSMKNRKDFIKFFEETDLGDYLESDDLRPVDFRLKNQDRSISLRLSSKLLGLLKKAATTHGTKYQRLIRSILEENVGRYLSKS